VRWRRNSIFLQKFIPPHFKLIFKLPPPSTHLKPLKYRSSKSCMQFLVYRSKSATKASNISVEKLLLGKIIVKDHSVPPYSILERVENINVEVLTGNRLKPRFHLNVHVAPFFLAEHNYVTADLPEHFNPEIY